MLPPFPYLCTMEMQIIAHIRNDLTTKFGAPRQSGLVDAIQSVIVFEPPFRNAEALRGLEGFSHLWLLWHFHQASAAHSGWSPTVRPPRLGGNVRMGVWATRSPFRPNGIGLSSVHLTGIDLSTPEGPVLHVSGADLVDGTPILDIKPYLPYTDSHPEATAGFTAATLTQRPLRVSLPAEFSSRFTPTQLQALTQILASDPRPHYHNDPTRVYVIEYAGLEVRFTVSNDGEVSVFLP